MTDDAIAPDADLEAQADVDSDETVRVWLVERTYSDDEQNIVILVYATPDGERYLRKERALTSFGDDRPTTAALDAPPENLGSVDDPETREQYAGEAARTAEQYDPTDEI
ncbi:MULTISPECIES: hypothetical protein [Halorussus]|uniref:hypothetical protein n=1 Tax=Halorussus TaxID=1070314 RepID=UPI00209F30AB|nr:hypothetical protein [Halorussus vallis]USZ73954.1 hypothetical protein NGM07_10845 [Halorussus vallis]